MSEKKVIDLEEYRNKHTAPVDKEPNEQPGVWELTTLPLLPASDGSSADAEPVRIVKVSSGFGKLRIPAWEETVRCMAA